MLEMKGNQMFRTISLTVVCLILSSTNSAVAQKPFKNKTARTAKKAYEQAIAEAKKEYVAKLKIAIKDAGGAGDLEEAKLLVAEKKRIDEGDPLVVLRNRMIGMTWISYPGMEKRSFHRNHLGRCRDGGVFRWYVTAPNTIVTQRPDKKAHIFVWHFDAKLKGASVHWFTKKQKTATAKRLR